MHRIKHEHIANEAQRLHRITGRTDQDANWREAIESLKILPSHTYNARGVTIDTAITDACFGYVTNWYRTGLQMYWHMCRETFERDLRHEPPRGFSWNVVDHGNFSQAFYLQPFSGQEYRVPNFIRDIELNRLHLNELTTFMRVRNTHIARPVLLVRPSSFWTACTMRFSLLTILCRAGRFYFYNTIEDALMSYDYSRTTFAAINLFLQGRRNYTGPMPLWNRKWVYNFDNLHESQVTGLAA